MSNTALNTPYISKDADRLIFITASVTAFFFITSWLSYGIMKTTGDADESDWRPTGHSTLSNVRCCCRRTLYESGDNAGSFTQKFARGSDSEADSGENSGPEDEDIGGNKIE